MKTPVPRSVTDIRDELHINIDLWKHEEDLRQQRNTVLLSANAFLAIGAGAVVGIDPSRSTVLTAGLALAGFGLLVCWLWRSLQRRHVVYAEFRRHQIRDLAAQLGYESMERQWEALRTPPDPPPVIVNFPKTGASFSADTFERSAIVTESRLPEVVAAGWGLAVIVGLLLAISS